MSQLMRTLNNIFYDEEILNEFRTYLLNKQNYLNKKLKQKFQKEPYSKFKLIDNKLVYQPKNLIVIENDEEKQQALEDLYNEDPNTIGKGITNFYKYVSNKYINIRREDVNEYLQTKGFFQVTQNMNRRINKPIIARYPNQTWGIDLIDMNEIIKGNKGWRYIMTVVDIFSRKVFLNKLKRKEAIDTQIAFQEIVNKNEIAPNYLMSDNGTEWLGVFKQYCDDNEIKQLFTRSYSPQANGVVERMNKEVRKIMRAFFVRNNNRVWYNIIDKIADNKNATFNATVNNAPDDIWSPSTDEVTRLNLPRGDPKLTAKLSLIKKAMAKIKKFKEEDNLEVDELVRVKMSSIFANVRKLVKENKTKQIVVTYTPDVFYIKKVIIPRKRLLERKKYVLENIDGKVLTKNGIDHLFYASELLRFKGETLEDIDIDINDALRLNGVERNANDIDY